jgi:protein-L-isoaspartate(D-aspartate) O-methyltransferase
MTDMNLEQARHNMIEQQIRPWDVLDQRVLDLLLRVPREEFVPASYRKVAFIDEELPLGHGEVMMSPKMEARLLQALAINSNDRILEVGTGSGYLTALLAHLGRHVFSVDINGDFIEQARQRLASHHITNVTLSQGDAANGWEVGIPYDVIILTGSLERLPESFKHALAVGGRLVAVVGTAPAMEAVLITRLGKNEWSEESLFETVLPPLRNTTAPHEFHL